MKNIRSQTLLFSDNTSMTINQCRNSSSMHNMHDGLVYYTLSIMLSTEKEKPDSERQLIQFGFPDGIEAFNIIYRLIHTDHIDESEQQAILITASDILENTKILGSLPLYMFPKINSQVQKIRDVAEKLPRLSSLSSSLSSSFG